MSFEVESTIQDVAVIRASGPLNMATASRFRELVIRIVGQDGRTRIVVDLAGTDFLDSTGLGALISGLKIARLAGGDLRIACPGTQVMTVLQLTGLDQILPAYAAAEECFESATSDASRSVA